MDEPQERERLRLLSDRTSIPLRKATKPDQLGLARFQGKRKFAQPLAQDPLHPLGVFSVLEAHYKVIDIPYQVRLASKARFDDPLEPQVQNLMQIQITEQHADRAALRCTGFIR